MSSTALKRGESKMSGLTKLTLVTRPEQRSKMEAGPISILMGANLRKPSKDISPEKQRTVKKEKDNG
jgi:hypothetical protein